MKKMHAARRGVTVIQCKLVKETVCTGTPAPAATRE